MDERELASLRDSIGGMLEEDQLETQHEALTQLADELEVAEPPVEVLLPTTLAYDIARRALVDSVTAVTGCSTEPAQLDELKRALDAAMGCLEIWAGVLAVDRGGLEDVDL